MRKWSPRLSISECWRSELTRITVANLRLNDFNLAEKYFVRGLTVTTKLVGHDREKTRHNSNLAKFYLLSKVEKGVLFLEGLLEKANQHSQMHAVAAELELLLGVR